MLCVQVDGFSDAGPRRPAPGRGDAAGVWHAEQPPAQKPRDAETQPQSEDVQG